MEGELQLQALRLELEEKERLIEQLRRQWEAERASQAARLQEAIAQRWEETLQRIAPSLAYLATQQQLWVQGKPPPLSAVFQNLERLFEGLAQIGVERIGHTSQPLPYKPQEHQFLGEGPPPPPGTLVSVRMVGLRFQGKVLHKAGVVLWQGDSP